VTSQPAASPLGGGIGQEKLFVLFLDALLGFEDKAAAFIEVDSAEGFGAIGIDEDDAALEDVGVVVIFLPRWFRTRDFEEVAEFAEKEGVIGAFGARGSRPAGDEDLDWVSRHAALADLDGMNWAR
jgi:hypothetical protein